MKIVSMTALLALSGLTAAQQFPLERSTYYGIGLGNQQRGSLFFGQRPGKVAYQLGIVNSFELDPFALVDGFPPNDTVALGEYRARPAFGGDLLFLLGEEQRAFYVGIGLYVQDYTLIGRSISTGSLYDLGTRTTFQGAYSFGFMGSTESGASLGFGWHSQLGLNLSIGVRTR